ncbi:MAG: hypothetical protein IPN58_09675 [Anaerolineales bacterium]|nr:hypothetical protein [Anaerolineales bacterium]
MTESIPETPMVEPQNRSTGALILFLFIALPMPLCLYIYHFIVWSTEQSAIISSSLKNLEWAGLIGLAVQAFVMTGIMAALWYFTKDDRFKPVYAGLFGAAVVAFPALLLRLLGPNNDQVGFIAQFLLCIIGALLVIRLRKIKLNGDVLLCHLDCWWRALVLRLSQFSARSVPLAMHF